MDTRLGLAAYAAVFALSACAAPPLVRAEGYCAPPTGITLPLPSEPPPPADASEAQRMAALVGLTGVLAERPRSEASPLVAVERIELARLAIAATAAELECERERAEEAADALSRAKSSQAQALTIGSIGAATVTSIASVFLSTGNASNVAQDSVAIGGGAVTAGLGLASIYVHPSVPFHTTRNLLAPLWIEPGWSPLYPPLVWAYLSRPEFSNDRRRSIREHLIERWRREAGLDRDASLARLLFGSGGEYDVHALRTRAELLDEAAAEVHLESQDLASLAAVLFAGPSS
jgi:hypothetical protein